MNVGFELILLKASVCEEVIYYDERIGKYLIKV